MNLIKPHILFVISAFLFSTLFIVVSVTTMTANSNIKTYHKDNKQLLSLYIDEYSDSLYCAVTVEQIQVHIMFLNRVYEEVDVENATIEYFLSLYVIRYGSTIYEEEHQIKN